MQVTTITTKRILALAITGLLVTFPVHAEKNKHKEHKEHKEKHDNGEHHDYDNKYDKDDRDDHGSHKRHFDDRQRTVINNYYIQEFRSGRCPPGLAKKHNGCAPPGHARKWVIGRPIPRDVIFYDLPPAVIVQLGAPLPGYRYVRVASDILLISIGAGLIVDAIQDVGRY
ncbi:MAG: hypothetical protein ACXW1W_08245 [Methylococcaceae bacterium]